MLESRSSILRKFGFSVSQKPGFFEKPGFLAAPPEVRQAILEKIRIVEIFRELWVKLRKITRTNKAKSRLFCKCC